MIKYTDCVKYIKIHMEGNSPPFIVIVLRQLKSIKQLDFYLKDTDYEILQWALEKDSFFLIKWLAGSLILEKRKAWMVSHNDYSAIANYVKNIVQLDLNSYNKVIEKKIAIIKFVVGMKFNKASQPVHDLIIEICENNKNSPILPDFLRRIEKIFTELTCEKIGRLATTYTFFAKRKRANLDDRQADTQENLPSQTRQKKRVKFTLLDDNDTPSKSSSIESDAENIAKTEQLNEDQKNDTEIMSVQSCSSP